MIRGSFLTLKRNYQVDVDISFGYKNKNEKNEEDRMHNKCVSQLRIVVENFIGKMKKFRCIKGTFRHYVESSNEKKREKFEICINGC